MTFDEWWKEKSGWGGEKLAEYQLAKSAYELGQNHNSFEVERLKQLIEAHNAECVKLCNDKKDCGYERYERDCGRCSKDWMIDV